MGGGAQAPVFVPDGQVAQARRVDTEGGGGRGALADGGIAGKQVVRVAVLVNNEVQAAVTDDDARHPRAPEHAAEVESAGQAPGGEQPAAVAARHRHVAQVGGQVRKGAQEAQVVVPHGDLGLQSLVEGRDDLPGDGVAEEVDRYEGQ